MHAAVITGHAGMFAAYFEMQCGRKTVAGWRASDKMV